MRGLRRILFNLLLIGVSFVVGLLMIEVGVRVLNLYRFPTDNFIQTHPELGWSHVPNKEGYWLVGNRRIPIKINSKGLRDKEYPYEKRAGTFRILVLGDSFTEAFQVPLEDAFCEVLEHKLNKSQRHFEVINAGFAGVGTDYELLFFRREGYKYDPDLVILAFFANDVYENYRSKNLLNDSAAPIAYEEKSALVNVRKVLAQNSCAYNYFGYVLPKRLPSLARVLMKLRLLSFQPLDNTQTLDQLHYLVFAKEYGPELEGAWNVTRIIISELKKEVDRYGMNLCVVSIPFKEQVYEDVGRSKLSKLGIEMVEWDLNKPEEILSGFLNDVGISFLPLLTDFRKAAEKSQLYYVGDGHWNVDGHHLAAEVIHEWLVDQRLIPSVKTQKAVRAQR